MEGITPQINPTREVGETEIDNSTEQQLSEERSAQFVGKTLFEELATTHAPENVDPARTHIVTTYPGGSQGIDP